MINFREFIAEREAIRKKKEAGLPRPWTEDEILDRSHFCNIDRKDDAFTKWLADEWLNKSKWSWANKLVAGRWFNSRAPLLRLLELDEYDYDGIKKAIQDSMDAGERVYNYKAYSRYLTKDTAEKFVKLMKQTHNIMRLPMTNRMGYLYQQLRKLTGVGPFLASQMTLDAELLDIANFIDADTWVPIGPGSKRGLYRVMGADVSEAHKHSDKDFVRDVDELSKELGFKPSVIEHALCEYDKYCRLALKEKAYGRKYVPGHSLLLEKRGR